MPPKKTSASTKEKAPAKKAKPSEEVPKKKPRAAASKASDSAPKPATKRAAKTKEDPPESENGVESHKPKPTRTTKAKPKQPAKSENPGSSKAGTTRGKRAKKEDPEKQDEESDSPPDTPPKKASKRKTKKADGGDADPSVEEKKSKPSRANPTATDWAAVDFGCAAKSASGKAPNYRIVSWNVDGMRAWMRKGGLELLQRAQPDVLCVQETKCTKEKIPEEMNGMEGYESFWCCSEREGYAGVGTLTRAKPLNVIYGIGAEDQDDEGRCVTVEMEAFFVVNVYVPNAGRKLVTLPKRLEWNIAFKAFIKRLDVKKPVIVCGDMNVAHKEIDLTNPKTNTKNAGFTPEEREGMSDFLQEGYIDTFRDLYPEKQAFTFWTYMMNARSKNIGWRLDYFIISERFKENVCDSVILQEVFGSDHCPIVLHINV